MNLNQVEKIADAVLYEGYILYPYRQSAIKNQQRWNFGVLCPESFSVAQGGTEAWSMQTECLISGSSEVALEVKVRFLHLLMRDICDPQSRVVQAIQVNGQILQTWQEAGEREVCVPLLTLEDGVSRQFPFGFPASEQLETLTDTISGEIAGHILRRQQAVEGTIDVTVKSLRDGLTKLNVSIRNTTTFEDAGQKSRDEALMRSMVSTHTILGLRRGQFVSLLDPPEDCREAANGCSNIGTYPVLVGEEGELDCMLSSPIILYDYPQIAPESAGALFDGTEIDEILTLRIMTLTDEEKEEIRAGDERARQILERTETLPQEQFLKMHGAMKSVSRKQ